MENKENCNLPLSIEILIKCRKIINHSSLIKPHRQKCYLKLSKYDKTIMSGYATIVVICKNRNLFTTDVSYLSINRTYLLILSKIIM